MPLHVELLSADEWEQLQMAVKARLGEFKSLIAEGIDESVTPNDRAWVIKTHQTMITLAKKVEDSAALRRHDYVTPTASLS